MNLLEKTTTYKKPLILFTVAMLLSGILVACQSTALLPDTSSPGISVAITDELCPNIQAQVGQQVTWANEGNQDHIVRDKSVDKTPQFDSGTLKPGDSFMFIFIEAGNFNYECSENADIQGSVTVTP